MSTDAYGEALHDFAEVIVSWVKEDSDSPEEASQLADDYTADAAFDLKERVKTILEEG